MRLMLGNGAIWVLIALFLTNQIAGNTTDFKMNVIKDVISVWLKGMQRYSIWII